AFDLGQPLGGSTCVSCGECVASCPTGALTNKPLGLPLVPRSQTTAVESVCPYCGVGCALTYHVKDNHILWAEGRESPGNPGPPCVKGRYGWDSARHDHRLTHPLIRRLEYYPKGPLSRDVRGSRIEDRGSTPAPRSSILDPRSSIFDPSEVLPAFREASWDESLAMVWRGLAQIRRAHGPRRPASFR